MRVNANSGSLQPDVALDFDEYLTLSGCSWRFAMPPLTITSPNYIAVTFRTPASTKYKSIYRFISYFKTGDELVNTLLEGPTTGGVGLPYTLINLDQTNTDVCPFTNLLYNNAMTLTGGTEITSSFVPGLAVGATQPGSAIQASGLMILKPDTLYGVKIQASGGSTKVSIILNLSTIKIGV